MQPKEHERFGVRKRFNALVKNFPTCLPVVLEVSKKVPKEYCGDCEDVVRSGKRVLLIRISSSLPRYIQFDSLYHEFAHAMTWKKTQINEEENWKHTPEWGVNYAKVWSWFADGHE